MLISQLNFAIVYTLLKLNIFDFHLNRVWLYINRLYVISNIAIFFHRWIEHVEKKKKFKLVISNWKNSKNAIKVGQLHKIFRAWSEDYIHYVYEERLIDGFEISASIYYKRKLTRDCFSLWKPVIISVYTNENLTCVVQYYMNNNV
mgnify:CR=1 FL=1